MMRPFEIGCVSQLLFCLWFSPLGSTNCPLLFVEADTFPWSEVGFDHTVVRMSEAAMFKCQHTDLSLSRYSNTRHHHQQQQQLNRHAVY
jgi:hypothetical protein